MRKTFLLALFAFSGLTAFSVLPAQQQPAPGAVSAGQPVTDTGGTVFLAGNGSGLFSIRPGTLGVSLLWQGGAVHKILRVQDFAPDAEGWYFLTDKGVLYSRDLQNFELRNDGLPVRTVKTFRNGEIAFVSEIQELADLCPLPGNPDVLVTATNKSVFLSEDGGRSWRSLGTSAITDGVKTAAPAMLPDETGRGKLTVLMSHPIYGISYLHPHDAGSRWTDLNDGLERMPTMESPDEVAAIAVSPDGSQVYASQSFLPALYRLDWEGRRFVRILRTEDFADSFDGLSVRGSGENAKLFFTARENLKMFSSTGLQNIPQWDSLSSLLRKPASCLYVPPAEAAALLGPGTNAGLSFSQMWLLHPEQVSSPYAVRADGRKGIYIPVWQATTEEGLDAHLKTIQDNSLNMLVIDMKDDYGFLRYDAQDPLVTEKGQTGRGIRLEEFVRKTDALDLYLVARIVVFKDRELSEYAGGKYAVWDSRENKPWRGYELREETIEEEGKEPRTETVRRYYDEYWVDPYSEEVWEYNVAIAKELIARGFDEIQFDYIRFPTDGRNLPDASYRWQSGGLDKESALLSFLRYARQEIKAPVSIDIYGANGWYRTGARTGQHINLLAKYVDVICPMFYPSHFENGFLAQEPAVERPYRIYYYGTFRNTILAKNQALVRPWAQAFYLNVAYDRTYYNENYVQQQIFGVRDSCNRGYTYWNNSGRYTDLRPDPPDTAPYPGTSPEAAAGRIFRVRRNNAPAEALQK